LSQVQEARQVVKLIALPPAMIGGRSVAIIFIPNFAAGPSTCGDEMTGPHHRRVHDRGQGVDGALLHLATTNVSHPLVKARATAQHLGNGGYSE
jgi:hypothetical protein